MGSDLFLEMLLRLQTPELATATTPALETELELSLEWSTPFFLLEWSFLPQNPDTLYLVDNSISLRWRWSY